MSETSTKHKMEAPKKVKVAIITCSDSKYAKARRGEEPGDVSGNAVEEAVKEAGHEISKRILIPDNLVLIKETVKELLYSKDVDAIIISGGTGISSKDVTVEAVKELVEKDLPGFGELFRKVSYEKLGPAAMLSRAMAGVAKSKIIFCLPGSPDGVKLALSKLILPELTHAVKHAKE